MEGLLADLDASRVERNVLVLERAAEYDVLEPLETRQLRKAVKTSILGVSFVGHGKLGEAFRLAPVF